MNPETSIEQSFVRWCKANGYLCMKAGLDGWPDRCVLLYDRQVLWIEFKTPVGRLSAPQVVMHKRITEAGHRVVVCRSLEEAIREVERNG